MNTAHTERNAAIRQAYAESAATLDAISVTFGVSPSQISKIAHAAGLHRNRGRKVGSSDPVLLDRNTEIVARIKAGGETNIEIGTDYGISYERVRQIGSAHGVTNSSRFLDPEKLQRARSLVQRGMPIAHAGASAGLNPMSFYARLVADGAHAPDTERLSAWSQREDDLLRTQYGTRTAAKIARELGRTRNEVIGRAYRLGLSRRTSPQSKKAA